MGYGNRLCNAVILVNTFLVGKFAQEPIVIGATLMTKLLFRRGSIVGRIRWASPGAPNQFTGRIFCKLDV